METRYPICCGLDVHQAIVSACLRRVSSDGTVNTQDRQFSTTVQDLTKLAQWLKEVGCPIAAMESTGVYWKPVFHILSPVLEVLVANARDVKQRRGKKTDPADARWIAELLALGRIEPSFIPPPQISALRDLIRMRTALVQNRTQVKNRILAILEDTNIKLASVVSDPFGVTGRSILNALVQGHRNAKALSQMARGTLRRRIEQLAIALEGSFTEHHGLLIGSNLEIMDQIKMQIDRLDARIRQLMEPMKKEAKQLQSIPGVNQTAARIIISEIGIDMSRFAEAARLCSWAGMCPGNNKTAGKRKSGRTRKANRYLRRVLTECAWAAGKTENFLGHTFRRLQARLGGKKAAVAVGHKILQIVFHLLNEGAVYDDGRYNRPSQKQEARQLRRALATLQQLGYQVQLTAAA